jgi:hypothetical protein
VQFLAAGSATRARAAHRADVLDGPRTFLDALLDVAVVGGVAEADDHGTNLKLAFKARLVKTDFHTHRETPCVIVPAMKKTTALCALLAAALALGACAKEDKKAGSSAASEKQAPAEPAVKKDEPAALPDLTKPEAKAEEEPADPTAADPAKADDGKTDPKADAKADPKTTGGTLELLSDGAEPRYQLTYQAPEGTTQKMAMSLDVTADVPMMGKMTMPTTIMVADVVVEKVVDGKITSKLTFSEMDVKDTKDSLPGVSGEMKKMLAKMNGSSMTMTISPSGKVLSFEADQVSDPMLQQTVGQTQQSLDQMVAQLPEKPVGKGAKWRIKQTISQQGMKITQTITYELVDVTATTAHIKGVAAMKAPKQDIEQQGVKVTLEKLDGSAKTDMTIDFTKIVPTITGDISMKMSMQMMGQAADVSMKTKMKIEPK